MLKDQCLPYYEHKLLFFKETNLCSSHLIKRRLLRNVFLSEDYQLQQEIKSSAISHIVIDPTKKFFLSGDFEGFTSIYETMDETKGTIKLLKKHQFANSLLQKVQWYPIDNGMFNATYPSLICFIETNSLVTVDSYNFGPKKRIYDSDWNKFNPALIAVGTSSSSIRFIDIRCGNALQQIEVESVLGHSVHNVTRVLWSQTDEDGLFAGDSSGHIHIFDMRMPKKSVYTVKSDQTVFGSIISLSYTCDLTRIISCHGVNNRIIQWCFKAGKLINTNINYSFYFPKHLKKSKDVSAFYQYQLFCTEDLLFRPLTRGKGDIAIHDLNTGELLRVIRNKDSDLTLKKEVNCVTGLYKDYFILIAGTRGSITVWGIDNNNSKCNKN